MSELDNQDIDSNSKDEISKRSIFASIIDNYLNSINGLYRISPFLDVSLTQNWERNACKVKKFMQEHNLSFIPKTKGSSVLTLEIPSELARTFTVLDKNARKLLGAKKLILQNLVVAFVSLYDAYITQLLHLAYVNKPDKLKECCKTFTYEDIIKWESMDDFKMNLIDMEVDSIIRDSHKKQLTIFSNKFGLKIKNNITCYDDFVEITERRNIFVHTNGRVSNQYLDKCGNKPFDYKYPIFNGLILEASLDYIRHCYYVLYEIGLMLGLLFWCKYGDSLDNMEMFINEQSYNLIDDKEYDLAIKVLNQIVKSKNLRLGKSSVENCYEDIAISYYLKGDKIHCQDILKNIDWVNSSPKQRLIKNVLLEDYENAVDLMYDENMELDKEAYMNWPVFYKLRETDIFLQAYKKIYGINYICYSINI